MALYTEVNKLVNILHSVPAMMRVELHHLLSAVRYKKITIISHSKFFFCFLICQNRCFIQRLFLGWIKFKGVGVLIAVL